MSGSQEEKVRYDVADGIATITMDAPARRNALDGEMLAALPVAFDRAGLDESVAVVVFTGAGEAFCAGGDLRGMGGTVDPVERKAEFTDVVHRAARAIERVDKPVIAMINGAAIGAGLDLALMCDLRIAVDTARLAESYITIGLVPGNGGAFLLPRLVGLPRALELLFTGRPILGREAAELGLVNRAVPADELATQTYALAAELAGKPRTAMRMLKRLVYESLQAPFPVAMELAASQVAILQCGEEHRDALAAVATRRPDRSG
jgi:enoyl-CoA hydratase/carnithine racemase